MCLKCYPLNPTKLTNDNEDLKANLKRTTGNLFVILDRVTDPHNFGSIVRSAHFLGADGIVSGRKHTCPINPTVSKVSAGAVELAPMFEVKNLGEFLNNSKLNGWKVVCTGLNKDEPSHTLQTLPVTKEDNVMIVLGSEGAGITHSVAETATHNLVIEGNTKSSVDSLNVGVTAGILLHSLRLKLN